MTGAPQRASAVGLVAISIWRLVLAGSAAYGLWLVLDGGTEIYWHNLAYFTQVCGLLVLVTAVGGLLSPLWNQGRIEGRRGVLRGASAACSALTLIVFATLLGADYSTTHSLLLHLVVPLMALVDWAFVGRNQTRVPVWVPAAWLALPLAYLPVYLWASDERGAGLYPFLQPRSPSFWTVAAILLVGFLVVFYAFWGIGKLRGLVGRRR